MAQTYTVTATASVAAAAGDTTDATSIANQVATLVGNLSTSLPITNCSAAISGGSTPYTLTLTATLTAPSADPVDAAGTTAQISAYMSGLVLNPPISNVVASYA